MSTDAVLDAMTAVLMGALVVLVVVLATFVSSDEQGSEPPGRTHHGR